MDPSVLILLRELCSLLSDRAYMVGGSVRDLLIGTPDIRDIDVLMPTGSETVARAFAERITGSFFFLDEERRITRVVTRREERPLQFDFTNFNGPDLVSDLGSRDFTINAMALEMAPFLETQSLDGLIDLFGGQDDLEARRIRLTSPSVIEDDPLRMLRAVRFAALLGFSLDAATEDGIRAGSELIVRTAPERVRDEFFQVLSLPGADSYLSLMDRLGLLARLLPELDALQGFSPGMYHAFDVRTHSLKAVHHLDGVLEDLPALAPDLAERVLAHLEEPLEHLVPRKAALRFACLLHDIAKPETFSRDDRGHIHFYGHDTLGSDRAQAICRRFRLSREAERAVTTVIRQHMRLFNLSVPGGPSKNAMFRYCRDAGTALPESLLLSQADARATVGIMPPDRFMDTRRPMLAVLEYYYLKFLKTGERPLVTGQDLIDRGHRPGPLFREILEDVRERQAAGTLSTRQEALAFLDRLKIPSE